MKILTTILLTALLLCTSLAAEEEPKLNEQLKKALTTPAPDDMPGDEAAQHCIFNLDFIGLSLEMYNADEGRYPESLGQLTPDYLKQIPPCPAAESDSYSAGYKAADGGWSVHCSGEHHQSAKFPSGHPKADSASGISAGDWSYPLFAPPR